MKLLLDKSFVLISLSLLVNAVSLTNAQLDKNVTINTETPPEKAKVDILKSEICTKCQCIAESSLMDCTNKLSDWFSDKEWQTIQNGDIVFDTIKMEKNNLTNIPVLPTYGVKYLYLGYNQIAKIAIGAFQNLTELATLDLSNNQLTSKALVPDVFKGPYSEKDFEPLKNLKSLNLGNNLLHSLDDDLFEHLEFLEELVLCSNTFQVIDKPTETALAGISTLKILDISYIEVKSLPETLLHGPRDLQTLIASGNLFIEVPKALSYAKNLKQLVLDENPIANLEKENIFPAMTNLNYLSISYMPDLYKIGTGAMSELQNLTELILSSNKMLTEIDANAFSKNITGGLYLDYPPLAEVYLSNCNLTVLPRDLIVRWDKVKVLDLTYNPWKCDETNEFMINNLLKQVNKLTPKLSSNVKCDSPNELRNFEVLQVADENLIATAHGSSLVWIILLVCVLLIIPLGLAGFVVYRRGYCGLGKKNETARRALYSRTSFNEDFHI